MVTNHNAASDCIHENVFEGFQAAWLTHTVHRAIVLGVPKMKITVQVEAEIMRNCTLAIHSLYPQKALNKS
eukprot:scaffold61630_cov18-Tisochrysis_lutea.AAC.1